MCMKKNDTMISILVTQKIMSLILLNYDDEIL